MSQVELNEIVNVQITRDTLQLSRVGFGTALLMVSGFTDTTEEVVKEYSSLSEILTDGFTTDDPAYKAAAAYFGQALRPAKLLIGEYDPADPMGSIAAIDAVNSDWYALMVADTFGEVEGVTRVERLLEIAAFIETQYRIFLVAAFGADTIDETVGDDDVSLTAQLKSLGYDRTATIWSGESAGTGEGANLLVNGDFSDDTGEPWGLLNSASADFSGGVLALTTNGVAGAGGFEQAVEISEPGSYALRFEVVSSEDESAAIQAAMEGVGQGDTFATTGIHEIIFHDVAAGTRDVSIVILDPAPLSAEYVFDNIVLVQIGTDSADHGDAAAAWLGRMLPTDPGSATWAHKNLKGVLAAKLNTTQRNNLFDKSGNLFSEVSGTNVTRWGTMASGEYLDIIHGIDWLRQRITEAVFRLLATQPKVAYTDAGIASIENELRAQLRNAQSVGLIAPDVEGTPGFIIDTPKVKDTDIADRAARVLRDLKFEARLAGAVHKVIIRGVVTP